MQSAIKGIADYDTRSNNHDLIWLLEQLKKTVSGVDVKENSHITMYDVLTTLPNTRKQLDEANNNYIDRFESNIHTVEMAYKCKSSRVTVIRVNC